MMTGMAPPPAGRLTLLKQQEKLANIKRKQLQLENKEEYDHNIHHAKDRIYTDEGPIYKNKLRDDRMKWLTDKVAEGAYPQNLEDFYTDQEAKQAATAAELTQVMTSEGKGKSGKESKKTESKAGAKEPSKDKKGGKKEALKEDLAAMPKPSAALDSMVKAVEQFKALWDHKGDADDEPIDPSASVYSEAKTYTRPAPAAAKESFDETLAKNELRPDVHDSIRKEVDDLLSMNLQKLQLQLASAKKGKGKKGKKNKKSKGKVKGKKGKPLPGEKISDLKGLDTNQMLSILIEHKLVVKCRERTIDNLIGDFNHLGSTYHNSDRHEPGTWTPEDPSYSQIRAMLTEYCILPNGSASIKEAIADEDLVKSVMLYGPGGTGMYVT